MHTHTHTPNKSHSLSNTLFQIGVWRLSSHLVTRSKNTEKKLSEKRGKKRVLVLFPLQFIFIFVSFFSLSFSCCNWLYYEMKVINVVLSLAVSVSDWAQQSPNYHRRTHQRWPTIPSQSMQWCLCTHVWRHTHWFQIKKKPTNNMKCSEPTQLAGVYPLYVTTTVALIHSLLTGEQPAWGFNWESEQVLAVHQIAELDGYFKWSDMNSRGSPPWLCCAY